MTELVSVVSAAIAAIAALASIWFSAKSVKEARTAQSVAELVARTDGRSAERTSHGRESVTSSYWMQFLLIENVGPGAARDVRAVVRSAGDRLPVARRNEDEAGIEGQSFAITIASLAPSGQIRRHDVTAYGDVPRVFVDLSWNDGRPDRQAQTYEVEMA